MRQPYEIVREKFVSPELCPPLTRERACSGNEIQHSWTNDHRIKWNEASILATESHKFSRKMRESIEIEKHSAIDQEGKPLDSTWRALFTMQN